MGRETGDTWTHTACTISKIQFAIKLSKSNFKEITEEHLSNGRGNCLHVGVYADRAPYRTILELCSEPSHGHLSGNACPQHPASCWLPASQQPSWWQQSVPRLEAYQKATTHRKCNPSLGFGQASYNNHFLKHHQKKMFHCETKSKRQRDWTSGSPRSLSRQFFQNFPKCFIPQWLGRGDGTPWGGYCSLFSKCPFSITVKGFNVNSMKVQ